MSKLVEVPICESDRFESLLASLVQRIVEGRQSDFPLRLIGIRSRGVPIAQRLAEELASRLNEPIPVGALDITLYRDDLDRSNHWPVLRGTEIPFEVDEAEIILVDDVLFTGRTVRAALNAVCDLGRPARVRLLVLVDRGGRELPIHADYVGMTVPVELKERVVVRVRPVDATDEIVRTPRGADSSRQ